MRITTTQFTSVPHMIAIFVLVTAILLATPGVQAQQVTAATPFYKPGDTIRLSIEFNGPDVADISTVRIYVRDLAESPKNQQGFETQIGGGDSQRVGTNKFTINLLVPEAVATGDFTLFQITANFTTARPSAVYRDTDLPDKLTFRIQNQKHFENPKIKTITELH